MWLVLSSNPITAQPVNKLPSFTVLTRASHWTLYHNFPKTSKEKTFEFAHLAHKITSLMQAGDHIFQASILVIAEHHHC
jgi:hypothetical protein